MGKINNNLTSTGNLTMNHSAGEIVGWQQRIGYAHENHPVGPWFGEIAYDPATPPPPATWRVKRVIGMTRATGAAGGNTSTNANWAETLDGSWLTSFFYGGQVREVGAGQSLNDWVVGDVWQNDPTSTGFDARAIPPRANDADLQHNGDLIYDQRRPPAPAVAPGVVPPPVPPLRWVQTRGVSRTIVEFPKIPSTVVGGRAVDGNTFGRSVNSGSAEEKAGVSRYTEEHVNVNLRIGAGGGAGGVLPVVPGACPGGIC